MHDRIHLNALPNGTLPLIDTATLDNVLLNGDQPLSTLRNALKDADAALRQQFYSGMAVDTLVHKRAQVVDTLIRHTYKLYLLKSDVTLVAVGGYGRGELHPYSDVDLLILLNDSHLQSDTYAIGGFIAFLWELGLPVSHSVRTLNECLTHAQMDVSIATNLLEARHIAGDEALFCSLQQHMLPDVFWSSQNFFTAKYREQQARHAKYHDTAYRLEPNIKEGPGGLRDIQMITWVARRHFNTKTLYSLVEHGFLTTDEYMILCDGQTFLWRIRFALHLMHGRCEDRLLFDSQVKLAKQFGYQDAPETLGVEHFMQDYYKTIKELGLLNEMLLQLLEEAIHGTGTLNPNPLNDAFEERAGFLYLRDPDLFVKRPAAMLDIFLVLEQHPSFKGISAGTLRLLRANLPRIDKTFRETPSNHALFMHILREPHGVTHELRRMNRYGVLGRYLPAFGKIVGRMQYDLFHAYTVDEHTLFVISNLRRFTLSRYDHEFPLCSKIMQSLQKPELAYLAALFHDIAKGRGGDHATLGAEEALEFCLEHGLSRYDARLVEWLVQHHLLLSLTAQKKDINEPHIVHDFSKQVGDQTHLDYLYLLTVADIRGTNPDLWNSWKASLCAQLYHNTSRALSLGLENPIDKDELIHEIQQDALILMHHQYRDTQNAFTLWASFPDEYFLHHSREEIAWHASCLDGQLGTGNVHVFLRQEAARGGTAVCIHSLQDEFIFGRITAALAELGLTVLDARLIPLKNGERIDTYVIQEDNGEPILDKERLAEIEQLLRRETHRYNALPMAVTRRTPRQVRMFTTPTRIQFDNDPVNLRTVLEISAADRPGLLSLIGQALGQCRVRLQNAKITTIGERAEDVFFITDFHNHPILDPTVREQLRSALISRLGEFI
jgi:[protein-PII] uridylyltransferase